ncbi:MAG TPA: four helix bundle protein [Anaerolineae bacterium]|nr:four helix bundle protein [Anaerolineae bacterium]HIP70025.1 four helix bundle protein [Anaerolineae bacterium]
MKYGDWLKNVPPHIRNDPLWGLETYRKALFIFDLAWHDCEQMLKHELGNPIARQLIRSSGSIGANIEEGFGRGFGKDYARFLRIALASARESRGWYYRGRRLLNPEVVNHRMELLGVIIANLTVLANQQKKR